MAKKTSSVGGGVIIRRTQGRPGGTRSSLGRAATAFAVRNPSAGSAGKHSSKKKTTVVPRNIAD